MNYAILILVIIGLFWLANKYFSYLKATRGSEGYAKRKIFSGLFMAFMALIGITSIFADALFELLQLNRPAQFEWMAFGAFAILALAGVRIANSGGKTEIQEKPAETRKSEVTQTHSGAGDNIGGDKIGGDKVLGNKTTIVNPVKKKRSKALTPLHPVNPDDIVGRAKDIEELETLLFNNKKVVVVNGLGGIGKTTLAEAYVFKHYNAYKHIVWIGLDGDSLAEHFAQNSDLVKNLDINTTGLEVQGVYEEILRKLRNLKKQPNLLVLDNATARLEKELRLLPSQPNWHLLVTSRATIATMHIKELDFLTAEEAIKLFQKHCIQISNVEQIAKIVEAVDYHTLCIEILAKTAQRSRTGINKLTSAIEKDLEVNTKTKHSHLSKIDNITSYLCSIFNLSALNKAEVGLMKQFTCLPPIFHTYDLIQFLLLSEEITKKEDFAETLTGLTEKGWLLYNAETDSYKMHRIITEVTKKTSTPTTTDIAYLIEQVSELLSIDQAKDNPVDKFKWTPFGETLLNQFMEASTSPSAQLQNNLALVLKALGDYEGAKALLEKAKKSDEQNFGEDHPTTAVRYSNLALVLQDLGDYEGAKALLEKAKKSAEQNFGEDHPTTAVRYSNLALVLKDLGDYEGAKALLEKAKKYDEQNFGEDHPTTAVSYSNLALVLQDLGDYEGAFPLRRKTLEIFESCFEPEHPYIIQAKQMLEQFVIDMMNQAAAQEKSKP